MIIGFDAKRAYHNGTGLGHYSRTLLQSLAEYYPENTYYLFNPKPGQFEVNGIGLQEIQPTGFADKLVPGLWRSSGVKKDIRHLKLDIYHGLSHEIPLGIHKTGVKSVVTIHDLIHERYPLQYNPIDVRIYRKKFRYACNHADHIIAISEQTKSDIIEFYGISPNKIWVCYQSCNPAFAQIFSEAEKNEVRTLLNLPDRFFLTVGSIIERKNLLGICKAMNMLGNETSVPLVVIGDGSSYKEKVKEYITRHNMEDRIIFLSDSHVARTNPAFISAAIFPQIYQSAIAMIYPSTFEGFGIPVLEALMSRCPVITSNVSSLPEAGGKGAYYIDPRKPVQIAEAMRNIMNDPSLAQSLKDFGTEHALNFTTQKTAERVMNIYKSL